MNADVAYYVWEVSFGSVDESHVERAYQVLCSPADGARWAVGRASRRVAVGRAVGRRSSSDLSPDAVFTFEVSRTFSRLECTKSPSRLSLSTPQRGPVSRTDATIL